MVLPPLCHSDRSASGVEESTVLDNEPTQNKICHLRRFLDSLRSLGMTCRGIVSFNQTSYICNGASPSPGLDGGAPRSESKINDCRGQSHINFIVGSTPLHCSGYWVFHSTKQVVIETWRAAGCRPYGNVPRFRIFRNIKRR